jgi:hypothetical protein
VGSVLGVRLATRPTSCRVTIVRVTGIIDGIGSLDASDWIALAALLVSVVVAVRSERRLGAERRDRKREDKRRDEEIGLLRAQVEGAEADRAARRRARIVAEQGSGSGGERADQITFTVRNLGPSVVWDVDLKVRTVTMNENETWQDATPRIPVAPAMNVGEQRDVTVEIPRAFSRRRDLALWARWRDDVDDHEAALIAISPIA